MSRISNTLNDEAFADAVKSKIQKLSTKNEATRVLALSVLDETFEHYGFSWDDVAFALFEYAKLYARSESNIEAKQKPQYKNTMKDGEWREARSGTGSVYGTINGIRCTIFKSKKNDGTYGAVANIEDDNQEWHRDFKSIEEAQEILTKIYGAT